jgi:dGTPase
VAARLGKLGERFLQHQQPGLEAQLSNVADEIAYNNHDVDDGLRAGLITIEQLVDIRLFQQQYEVVIKQYPSLSLRRIIHEVVRRMINRQVTDLVDTSHKRITAANPPSIDAVREQGGPLIGFSDTMQGMNLELKRFLRTHMYQHYKVRRMTNMADRIVRELFEAFHGDSQLLPPDYQAKVLPMERENGIAGRARVVADYIAGMTDRFAISEHERLFDISRSQTSAGPYC